MLTPFDPRPRRLPGGPVGPGRAEFARALDALAAEPAAVPVPVPAVPDPDAIAELAGGITTTAPADVSTPATLVRPDFAAAQAAFQATRPEARDTRSARIAQLVASLAGGVATVAAGPEQSGVFGGLSAVLGGAGQGAGRYAQTVEAEDRARMAAFQTGLSDVIGKRIAGETAAYGDDVRQQTAVIQEGGLNARNAADNLSNERNTDALITGRTTVQQMQDATDLLQGAEENGDVEAARRYAIAAGKDPEAAASNAQRVRDDITTVETRLGRTLDETERFHRASISLGYTNAQEAARHNRRTEAISQQNANRPRGSGGGSEETPDEWRYDERNSLFSERNKGNITQDEYDEAIGRVEAEYARRRGGDTPASNPAGAGRGPIGAAMWNGHDLNSGPTILRLRAGGMSDAEIDALRSRVAR